MHFDERRFRTLGRRFDTRRWGLFGGSRLRWRGSVFADLDDLTAVDAEWRGAEHVFSGARTAQHRQKHFLDG